VAAGFGGNSPGAWQFGAIRRHGAGGRHRAYPRERDSIGRRLARLRRHGAVFMSC